MLDEVIDILSSEMPSVLRWSGAVARQLRGHDVALGGKQSGNINTDALTLADLSLQELLVAALRDCGPPVTECRIEAEESTGDLEAFAKESQYVIALDPIDGTKQFRDRTGDGYSVMLHVRDATSVYYSLVYLPEMGPQGTWVSVNGTVVKCVPDDWSQHATAVLEDAPALSRETRSDGKGIYLIGYQNLDRERAQMVTDRGFHGVAANDTPGSIYPLMARGQFLGSLIHTPNIYDFPVAVHIARAFDGDAVNVHTRQPIDFRDLWMDEKSDMLRLRGIAACSTDLDTLDTLCEIAADWDPVRYSEGRPSS